MFNSQNGGLPPNFEQMLQQALANPNFVNSVQQSNPQAYQMAMQMRNTMDPRTAIMQAARSKGIDPTILLQRLGLK